jgi:hypothetical protein
VRAANAVSSRFVPPPQVFVCALSVLALLVVSVAVGCGGLDDRLAARSGASAYSMRAPSPDSLRSQLLAVSDRLTAIYLSRDGLALDSLLAPDYLGSAPGLEWNRDSLRAEFAHIRMTGCVREGATAKWLAAGTALLIEDISLIESFAGEDISGRYRMTAIWVSVGAGWKLLFEQEMAIPTASESPNR